MKNNISFVYYLGKDTKDQLIIKDLLYIVPFSQFIKKYNKDTYTLINLTSFYENHEKEDYILIDWYQNIDSSNHIISYKRRSLKNIMASRFNLSNMVQLITFSKKTNINKILSEIFPRYENGYDDLKKAKKKVRNFIIETIKEYEK